MEDGFPGAAKVVGLPDAAVVDTHEEHAGLIGNADATNGAARTEGADETVFEALVVGGADVIGM